MTVIVIFSFIFFEMLSIVSCVLGKTVPCRKWTCYSIAFAVRIANDWMIAKSAPDLHNLANDLLIPSIEDVRKLTVGETTQRRNQRYQLFQCKPGLAEPLISKSDYLGALVTAASFSSHAQRTRYYMYICLVCCSDWLIYEPCRSKKPSLRKL